MNEKNLNLLNIYDLIDYGKTNIIKYPEIKPEQVLTFCFTSGTTGYSKAAMLTQGNFASVFANDAEFPVI